MMPRKSIAELITQANTTIEDNTSGAITPSDVRQLIIDTLNAIKPAYGQLTVPTSKTQVVSIAASLLTFTAAYDSSAETVSNFGLGTIARSERGTCTIDFAVGIEGPAGRNVTVILYKNGVATPWKRSINCEGAGNPVGCGFSTTDYADPAATYTIMVSCSVNNTTLTFFDASMLLRILPVTSFV